MKLNNAVICNKTRRSLLWHHFHTLMFGLILRERASFVKPHHVKDVHSQHLNRTGAVVACIQSSLY